MDSLRIFHAHKMKNVHKEDQLPKSRNFRKPCEEKGQTPIRQRFIHGDLYGALNEQFTYSRKKTITDFLYGSAFGQTVGTILPPAPIAHNMGVRGISIIYGHSSLVDEVCLFVMRSSTLCVILFIQSGWVGEVRRILATRIFPMHRSIRSPRWSLLLWAIVSIMAILCGGGYSTTTTNRLQYCA